MWCSLLKRFCLIHSINQRKLNFGEILLNVEIPHQRLIDEANECVEFISFYYWQSNKIGRLKYPFEDLWLDHNLLIAVELHAYLVVDTLVFLIFIAKLCLPSLFRRIPKSNDGQGLLWSRPPLPIHIKNRDHHFKMHWLVTHIEHILDKFLHLRPNMVFHKQVRQSHDECLTYECLNGNPPFAQNAGLPIHGSIPNGSHQSTKFLGIYDGIGCLN